MVDTIDDITKRASRIKIVIVDCDGVLTDGRIIILPQGEGTKAFDEAKGFDETKAFDVKDGHAIVMLQHAGVKAAIISGRRSSVVRARAKELGVAHLYEMAWVKTEPYEKILAEEGLKDEEACYIGDDVIDIPLLRRAGLAVTVADGVEEAKQYSHLVTKRAGGRGAVREVIELILKAQNKWQEALARYIKD